MRLPLNIEDVKNKFDFHEKTNDARRMKLAIEYAASKSGNEEIVNEIYKNLPEFIPQDASIYKNMEEAKNKGLYDLYSAVKNKGKWDYKQLVGYGLYEDFGNANYAAVTHARGISKVIARFGAGIAQVLAGTSPLKKKYPSFGLYGRPGVIRGVGLLDIYRDPHFGDDSRDAIPMEKIWEAISDYENLDPVPEPERKTRLSEPKGDKNEIINNPIYRIP